MDNRELAQELVWRLNALILDNPDVRADVQSLIEKRVDCSEATATHPTIQVSAIAEPPIFGFLGLLNGIVGCIQDGPRKDDGYICALYDEYGQLTGFAITSSE